MSYLDDKYPSMSMPNNKRVLEQAQLGMQYVVDTAKYEMLPYSDEYFRDMLMARLEAYVLRDHIASDFFESPTEEPTTWWQMWKRDHAPAWLLRRYPVDYWKRTVKVKVDRYLTYPDAAIRMPDMGRAYIFEETSRWH